MSENCIFCKIIKGEIAAEKVYEDDSIFAIMDIKPVSRGHVLVLPKSHANDFLSTPDEVLQDTIKKVKKIGSAIMTAVNSQGLNITTNNGAAAGQVVFHLHFHLIPRFGDDNLPVWPHHQTEHLKREEIAEMIRKQL